MKKQAALILAFAMAVSTGVTAFAETTGTTTITDDTVDKAVSIPVHGTYKAPGAMLSVDIGWDPMSFTYQEGSKGTWDTTNHVYTGVTESEWVWDKPNGTPTDQALPKITVTNHSNVNVKADFAFNAETDYTNKLTGDFSNGSISLDAGMLNGPDAAASDSTTFTFADTTSLTKDDIPQDKKDALGTITVTITQNGDAITPSEPTRIEVSSVKTLEDRLNGEKYANIIFTLKNNVYSITASTKNVDKTSNITIDLNNKTWEPYSIGNSGTLTLKNGTVSFSNYSFLNNNGNVFVQDCIIKDGYITNTFTGTIVFSGKVNIDANKLTNKGTIICLEGTYNFDPTDYVDEDSFTVNLDETGTSWTVKANDNA